jgi:hypothetical protein
MGLTKENQLQEFDRIMKIRLLLTKKKLRLFEFGEMNVVLIIFDLNK